MLNGTTSEKTILAYIQAGGRSSRMGSDKAWIEFGGRPMIARVLDAAKRALPGLAIVIDAGNPLRERYRRLAEDNGARLIADLHDRLGPLGGIHTALSDCRQGESAFILACDLPLISAEFIALLARIHASGDFDLTLPVNSDGRLQALAGIYSPACLPAAARMLDRRMLRVDGLCPLVRTRRVEFAEFSQLPDAGRLLANVNTPEDLAGLG